MASEIVLWVLAVVLVVVGVVGTVMPALPGPMLVLAGLFLAAWVEDFVHVGSFAIGTMVVLAGLTFAADIAASALGVKRLGASRRAVFGAAIGAVVGIFFGLPGILLGPFVGAVLGEYTTQRDLHQAGRAGVGAWIGVVLGAAAKLALVFAMIGVYLGARFVA